GNGSRKHRLSVRDRHPKTPKCARAGSPDRSTRRWKYADLRRSRQWHPATPGTFAQIYDEANLLARAHGAGAEIEQHPSRSSRIRVLVFRGMPQTRIRLE